MPHVLDVRPWNLFVGVTLAASASACSSRPLTLDGGSEDEATSGTSESTSQTSTTTTNPTTTTTTGDECQSDADCPPGYYCLDGMCEYLIAPDGHGWYQCYTDAECEQLELCRYNYCELQPSPAQCGTPAEQPIPLPQQSVALALSFADVDADGAEELVVATETELHVFEHGSVDPTVIQRGIDSPNILDMAAGELDGQPGDDLAILHTGNMRLIHTSDGMGGFGPASEQPVPLIGALGLIVESFDGGDGILTWGSDGAMLETIGPAQQLASALVYDAAYRAPSTGAGGFSLRDSAWLSFHALDGSLDDSLFLDVGQPGGLLASIVSDGEPLEIAGDTIDDWTLLSSFLVTTPSFAGTSGVPLVISEMAGANLLGDTRDDIVFIAYGELWIYRDVGDVGNECLVMVEVGQPVSEIAIGDHDGDGDDELGVRLSNGAVMLVDDEG